MIFNERIFVDDQACKIFFFARFLVFHGQLRALVHDEFRAGHDFKHIVYGVIAVVQGDGGVGIGDRHQHAFGRDDGHERERSVRRATV